MEALDTEAVDDRSTATRRRFLKHLGVTLAVGAGAGFFARSASAAGNNCCYNPSVCGADGCDWANGWAHLWCSCPGGGSYCWTAYCAQGGCFTGPC